MEQFVGLDISQSMTHLCVVDGKGKRISLASALLRRSPSLLPLMIQSASTNREVSGRILA